MHTFLSEKAKGKDELRNLAGGGRIILKLFLSKSGVRVQTMSVRIECRTSECGNGPAGSIEGRKFHDQLSVSLQEAAWS
jgi:hypothetical protein